MFRLICSRPTNLLTFDSTKFCEREAALQYPDWD